MSTFNVVFQCCPSMLSIYMKFPQIVEFNVEIVYKFRKLKTRLKILTHNYSNLKLTLTATNVSFEAMSSMYLIFFMY